MELPRQAVADFLETIDPAICARFVEYLIDEKGDESTLFHNRLAELYLRMTLAAKKRGDSGTTDVYMVVTSPLYTAHHRKATGDEDQIPAVHRHNVSL